MSKEELYCAVLYLVGIGTCRRGEEGRALGGGGRDEGGELEAEPLHVQPPVLLHVLPLHLAPATAAVRGPFPSSRAALPPALHIRSRYGLVAVVLDLGGCKLRWRLDVLCRLPGTSAHLYRTGSARGGGEVKGNEGYAPSDSNAWTDGCGQLRESRVPGCVWGPAHPECCSPVTHVLVFFSLYKRNTFLLLRWVVRPVSFFFTRSRNRGFTDDRRNFWRFSRTISVDLCSAGGERLCYRIATSF
jgi:hypothetical protein